jgi:hypothetical protein
MKQAALACALVLAQSAGLASAQGASLDTAPYTRAGFELGAQASRYRYEEPGFMKLYGYRGGAVGAFTHTGNNRVFFRFDARLSHGILDYLGSGTLDDVQDWILEARAVFGKDLPLGRRTVLAPYLGLGFRFLYNDLRGTASTGALGYERIARYVYLPLGASLRLALGSRWVLAPTAEYDLFLRGRQRSELTDTGIPGLMDANNTQNRGNGYRFSLMLEGERWSFGPWYHFWHIRDSLTVAVGPGLIGAEPQNKTREGGIELRYRF